MADTVTVLLDRRRPYRAHAKDRVAVWVGPGRAEVPAWVAREWGLEPLQPPQPEPTVEDAPRPKRRRSTRRKKDTGNG